jgi:hypothetical protein
MKRLLFFIVLLIFIMGCATAKPLQTASGRPEIIIYNTTKKAVVDTLVSAFVPHGLQIKQMNEYNVVFAMRDTSLRGAIFFGSKYDTMPEARVTFTFVETGNTVRVFCTAAMVTNPGSAFERVTDVTEAEANSLQTMLEKLKAKFNTTCVPEQSSTAGADEEARKYRERKARGEVN